MAKKELPFCGFMRISVQDNDGLEKRLKGCIMEAPLHKKVEGDNVVLFADLPKEDPIRFLQITSDENDHLACLWWFGSGKRETHERYPCDKLLAIMNTVKTKPVVDKLEDAVSSFTARACMPYIPDGYNRLVEVKFHTKELKFITRITRIELSIPKGYFEEWQSYYDALKANREEDKKDDEKK